MSENESVFVAIAGSAKNWEDALRLCGKALEERGCIGSAFTSACIEREKSFPTGLPTVLPVAIPHAASDAVYKTSVCVLKLEEPVKFYRMDSSEESVEVRLVFNLAIQGHGAHLDFLQKLMGFVMDEQRLQTCMQLSVEEIAKYLESAIVAEEK